MSVLAKHEARLIEGIERYCQLSANRSDPFCRVRCLAHLRSGILAGHNNGAYIETRIYRTLDIETGESWTETRELVHKGDKEEREPALYDASPYYEQVNLDTPLSNGDFSYMRRDWKNGVRP